MLQTALQMVLPLKFLVQSTGISSMIKVAFILLSTMQSGFQIFPMQGFLHNIGASMQMSIFNASWHYYGEIFSWMQALLVSEKFMKTICFDPKYNTPCFYSVSSSAEFHIFYERIKRNTNNNLLESILPWQRTQREKTVISTYMFPLSSMMTMLHCSCLCQWMGVFFQKG